MDLTEDDLAVIEARLSAIAVGQIQDPWYKRDVALLLEEYERMRNKVTQLERKLEKGPCGRCMKKNVVPIEGLEDD